MRGESCRGELHLSPGRSAEPRGGPPRRRGRCTPPPPTPLPPRHHRSPPAGEAEGWAPQTPARLRAEGAGARLRLEKSRGDGGGAEEKNENPIRGEERQRLRNSVGLQGTLMTRLAFPCMQERELGGQDHA